MDAEREELEKRFSLCSSERQVWHWLWYKRPRKYVLKMREGSWKGNSTWLEHFMHVLLMMWGGGWTHTCTKSKEKHKMIHVQNSLFFRMCVLSSQLSEPTDYKYCTTNWLDYSLYSVGVVVEWRMEDDGGKKRWLVIKENPYNAHLYTYISVYTYIYIYVYTYNMYTYTLKSTRISF